MIRIILAFLVALLAVSPAAAQRVKDLGGFQGVRTNQLTGYGVVVGLPGTGDDNLEYTVQSMKGVASRFGFQLPAGVSPGLKNAAVVMITADLPAFAKPGQKLDITVSSMGKAKSLRGGTLILTPLLGADGAIYAMAQGNLAVGGLGAEGKDGSSVVVNIPSSGRIPEGATVERTVDTGFDSTPFLTFNLARSDFTTAQRVQDAINNRFGSARARAVDGVSSTASYRSREAPQGMGLQNMSCRFSSTQQTAATTRARTPWDTRTKIFCDGRRTPTSSAAWVTAHQPRRRSQSSWSRTRAGRHRRARPSRRTSPSSSRTARRRCRTASASSHRSR